MEYSKLRLGAVELVPVTIEDAAFIFEVRKPAVQLGFLHKGAESAEGQRAWLESYLAKRDPRHDHYFTIREHGQKCGTVRVNNLDPCRGIFTWGSWCIAPGRSPYVAVASYLLANDLGFSAYNKSYAEFEVHEANAGVISFHRRMGASETGCKKNMQIEFRLTRDAYLRARTAWADRLNRKAT